MFDSVSSLPYPGLRAFSRDESMLFFGREDCVDAMIERLATTRFLSVLGASGSGKSSLVRTGLFDGLELGFFARAGARWRIVETHPGGAPIRNLAEALAKAGDEGDLPEDIETLLNRGRRSLIEWASGARLAPGENLLVLVDQFEEIFRYADYAAREEAEDFVALLIESARAADLPIHIVITMRSEYLGACALIPGLAEQLNAGFYLTPRMTREECRRAIEGPAAIMGFNIEPALTTCILNDMAGFAPWEEETGVVQGQILSRRADQLPLMQHLLNRLWLRASEKAGDAPILLTVADYKAIGGLIGALDAHGAEVLASLGEADRNHTAIVFRALISGPDPTNAVRRPCRLAEIETELAAHPDAVGAAKRIINAFRAADCNFLQPPARVPLSEETLIDISHESLIRQWDTLSQWLHDEARAGGNWRRLHSAQQRYELGEGDLLRGVDLQSIAAWWESERPTEAWSARHGGNFQNITRFLDQSIAMGERAAVELLERARKERHRLRLTLGIVSTLLLVAVILGIVVWVQGKERQILAGQKERLIGEIAQLRSDIAITLISAEEELSNVKQQTSQQIDELKDLKNDVETRRAAIERLQSENEKLNQDRIRTEKIMSINNNKDTVRSAVEYCQSERNNEEGCKRLLGRN